MLSTILFALTALATFGSAHIVIEYPGWRGNNLITNETFPYGMQWIFPCGGLTLTTNRTYWPTTGGAIAFQPGWFQGHKTAFMNINLGLGNEGPDGGPLNFTHPMMSVFQIVGPNNNPYPGTFCFPQVPLPAGIEVKPGENATIQIVELAQHGAALYSCIDITFAEPGDERINQVNGTNCYNSTDIGYAEVYSITTTAPVQNLPAGAGSLAPPSWRMLATTIAPLLLGALWAV